MRLSMSSNVNLILLAAVFGAANAQDNFPLLATQTDSKSSATKTSDKSPEKSSSSSESSKTTAAASPKNTDSGAITSAVPLSSGTSSYDGIQNAPTVTIGGGAAVPSYPPPTIPPTADAPFMQKSSLPSGTVFISVGAVLGFALALVLLWRGLVAWSLHRSMKRAQGGYALMDPLAKSRIPSETKSMLMAPFQSAKDRGSMLSLDPLATSGRSQGHRGSLIPSAERQSLFFSPTAGAGAPTPASDRTSVGANIRTSTYLPAGFYQTAGAPRPGSTGGAAYPTSTQDLLGNNRPSSVYRSYSDTPSLTPLNDLPPPLPYGRNDAARRSSGSVSTPVAGRAPSAYLDDLFDLPAVPDANLQH